MFLFKRTTLDESACLQKWHDTPSVKRWVPIENWDEYYRAVSPLENYYLYSVYLQGKLIAHIAAETEKHSAAICLVVDPAHHGEGLGTAVLIEMQKRTNELFGNISSYIAGIFPENRSSIRCFEKAGFLKAGKGKDGEDIYTNHIGRI